MVPFRPIEANNNGQMVPQAESIWEGNYTNAAVARNAKQMLTTETTMERVLYKFNKWDWFAELLLCKESYLFRKTS